MPTRLYLVSFHYFNDVMRKISKIFFFPAFLLFWFKNHFLVHIKNKDFDVM